MLVVLSAGTRCAPSSWPSQPGFVSRMAKLQLATGATNLCWNQVFVLLDPPICFATTPFSFCYHPHSIFYEHLDFCWNRGPFLLEPTGGYAARSTPRRRKLHPVARRVAANAVRTLEVATVYAGATTGDWGSRKRGGCILLNNFLFAGTDVLFCWNRDKFLFHWLQSSQMLMSFLLEPKFGFAGSVF